MAADWRVTAQRQSTTLTPDGQFRDVIEVSFETIPEGLSGKEVFALPQYTEDNVRDRLDNRVALMKAIHKL